MVDQSDTSSSLPAGDSMGASSPDQESSQPQTSIGEPMGNAPPPPPWVQEGTPQDSQEETSVLPSPPSSEVVPGQSQGLGGSAPPVPPPSDTGSMQSSSSDLGTPPPPSFSTSSVGGVAAGGGEILIKKLLPIIAIVAVIGIIAFLVIKFVLPKVQNLIPGVLTDSGGTESSQTKANLTYWGLWEPEGVISEVVADYQNTHPNVTINYVQHSPKDYRERLQSALAAGSGPDIFRFHNTWVPMLKAELDTVPKGTVSLDEYFPVVAQDLQVGTELVGIPLMFDGLALYYNPRLFDQAGKKVPTTWEELRKTAIDMTVYDQLGKIQTAGIALGTTNNVDNFSDILGLMMLQNGADPAKPNSSLVEETLRFYIIFTTTDRVWNETLPASTYAFAVERVAMIIAPSWRAFQIKETNPDLQFATAPVPQLPGVNISWGSYWVEGVSRRSKNSKAAWEFLQYLSSNEVLTKMYSSQAQLRLFGEPYPKKSLALSLENDPVVGAFVKQGETAKSWYLASRTFDNGINDKIIKYYEDAINKLLVGKSSDEALQPVAAGVAQVLSQYGVAAK